MLNIEIHFSREKNLYLSIAMLRKSAYRVLSAKFIKFHVYLRASSYVDRNFWYATLNIHFNWRVFRLAKFQKLMRPAFNDTHVYVVECEFERRKIREIYALRELLTRKIEIRWFLNELLWLLWMKFGEIYGSRIYDHACCVLGGK